MSDSKIVKYAEDSVIISEGEKIDKMFKVVSGGVAIYLNYGKENEYLVGVLTEKRHFGEEGLLSDKPSVFTAIAFEETHLMAIGASEFEDYLRNNYQNMLSIMRDMSEKITTLKANLNLLDNELKAGIQREEFKKKSKELVLSRYSAFASALHRFNSNS